MAEAARKDEMMDAAPRIEAQTPMRFGTPDLADKGIGMAKRLREKYPHLQDRFILSWLGGLTAQNNYRFVHTKNAVALAERFIEALNPIPSVKVWFVLARDPKNQEHIEECANLYVDLAKWATDVGASRVIDLDRLTDVPRALMKERLGGRMMVEESLFIPISAKK